jgi:hypothetical protein
LPAWTRSRLPSFAPGVTRSSEEPVDAFKEFADGALRDLIEPVERLVDRLPRRLVENIGLGWGSAG